MDIRSKLELFNVNNTAGKAETPVRSGADIRDAIPGRVCCNDEGTFYIVEKSYPLSYSYGGYSLGDALNISARSLTTLSDDNCSGKQAGDFLFFDTETTGLSGGAGTVAFLAGTGFFADGAFVIRQFFMRDYDEEPALLFELNKFMSGFSGLITYNGKAFDWNLLQSRFVANRIRPAMREPLQLDLLYPARRIWGLKLPNCRLSSLEDNILGEPRIGDIPGSMIPSVYFRYLEDRDASGIADIMKHNELDILSMAALLKRLSAMLESPLDNACDGHELLGLGRIFQKKGEYDIMAECLESCAGYGDYRVRTAAVRHLAGLYKKHGRYEKAMAHWKKAAEDTEGFELFPLIEMAMYYEHKEKNIDLALEIVEQAVLYCENKGLTGNRQFEELCRRKARLVRKAGRI